MIFRRNPMRFVAIAHSKGLCLKEPKVVFDWLRVHFALAAFLYLCLFDNFKAQQSGNMFDRTPHVAIISNTVPAPRVPVA